MIQIGRLTLSFIIDITSDVRCRSIPCGVLLDSKEEFRGAQQEGGGGLERRGKSNFQTFKVGPTVFTGGGDGNDIRTTSVRQ